MGFWYFLLLFLGLIFVVKGLLGNKKYSLVVIGIVCIGLSIFMFSSQSDEIISELLNLK